MPHEDPFRTQTFGTGTPNAERPAMLPRRDVVNLDEWRKAHPANEEVMRGIEERRLAARQRAAHAGASVHHLREAQTAFTGQPPQARTFEGQTWAIDAARHSPETADTLQRLKRQREELADTFENVARQRRVDATIDTWLDGRSKFGLMLSRVIQTSDSPLDQLATKYGEIERSILEIEARRFKSQG